MKMQIKPISIALLVASMLFASCNLQNNLSKKSSKPTSWTLDEAKMNSKIDSLLSVMTLDEKIGQTVLLSSSRDITGPSIKKDYEKYVKEGKVGNIFNAYSADFTRALQRSAVENTRLGIPLIFGYDVIHGHRTIFPISLGESSSWDLEAIEKGARISATEASAEGIHWTFAPMVDVARDPRWGRVSEGAGEDVYLACKIAEARVKGFQGNNLAATNTILACAKHYAAYGAAQAGKDYNTVDLSDRELRTTYLPPFKAAVDAGVATFMTSFNEINGVPATGNQYLLNDILREEWGFQGFVVTDYTSINEMVPHGIAANEKDATEMAINAGVDMDLQGFVYLKYLKKLVEEKKISEDQVNAAARRILELKYMLGLFDDPYRYCSEERQNKFVLNKENLEATRDVAKKSMVLLKNDTKTLPLSNEKTVALIGPLANKKADMIGSWSAAGDKKEKPVTVLEGLKEKFGNPSKLLFAKGTDIDSNKKDGFAEAIDIAKKSDVIVAVMGESANMSGEASSRTNLNLPGNQQELLRELKKLNKPMILVLMNGRPLTLEWEDENMDAILETWYSGTMGGHAIADVLFGKYNPSGKLTMSFPRNVGQIPIYYNVKNTGRPIETNKPFGKYRSNYLDVLNTPLYPFGYGLSYTKFEYSNLSLSTNELNADTEIMVSVDVENAGGYDGEEVVQLYIKDVVGSVTRPVRELKGFKKILIKKGETKTVTFNLRVSDLKFYDIDMNFVAEPGNFEVFVGGDSNAKLMASFTLIDREQ